MAMYLQATSGPPSGNVRQNQITRNSADFHPSVWGDRFLAYDKSSALTNDADEKEKQHLELLKQEVQKKMSVTKGDELMELIDDIQRLGVAYHFEAEIDASLQHMNETFLEYCGTRADDELHHIALSFRLLRQQGHHVSSDVFKKFMDSKGKFKEYLTKDVRGMLDLYEATYLRVHGEDVLEEALEFTTTQLNDLLKSQTISNPFAIQVARALKCPLRKSLTRVEAVHYISIYPELKSHDGVLLQFAKLDFNLVQKLHQEEIGHITRWWKDLDVENKFPFARDRIVECCFWVLGVYFEPKYAMARRFLTKVTSMTSIIDDLYDVYGTLDELVLFTDAIEKWDISALDQLPEYMKYIYKALLDVYDEAEEKLTQEGKPFYDIQYAKNAYKISVRAYFAEAKWCNESYVPTTEEYMSVALATCGYPMMSTTSFVGMGDVSTKEAFDWVSTEPVPLVVTASAKICRIHDDIVGHEFEQKRPHVTSVVECYMRQHGVSKEIAYVALWKDVTNAWKDINQECLLPTAVSMPLLTRICNLARVINLLYIDGVDCYTHSTTKTKDLIVSILIDPIPL